MPLGVNELKSKTFIIYEGQPYLVLETHHLKMQQRRPTVQIKMRNVINSKILERNFAQSDVFEEAEIERQKVRFVYVHRNQYWFSKENDPSQRFELKEDVLGDSIKFLKPNTIIEAVLFQKKVIDIELPIKMDFKVSETQPGVQGDRATAGTKSATLETGAVVQVPPFINVGDIVRINTQSGDYTERVEKG